MFDFNVKKSLEVVSQQVEEVQEINIELREENRRLNLIIRSLLDAIENGTITKNDVRIKKQMFKPYDAPLL